MKRSTSILCIAALVLTACVKDATGPKSGPPAAVAPAGGTDQIGDVGVALSAPLSARVTDAAGAPVANAPITWTTSNGTIVPLTPTTDATGVAQARWTLGTTAGTAVAQASVGTLPAITFTATVRPGAVASVAVSGPGTLNVGQRVQMTAAARDAFGNTIQGRTFVWTALPSQVAIVDQTGGVTGLQGGNATIMASTGGLQGSATVNVAQANTSVVINNRLLRPVTVVINGSTAGTVGAQASSQFSAPRTALTVSFSLNRITTTQGNPVGETMNGVFNTISTPATTETFIIDNVIGGQQYFSPQISNNSAATLLMGVNMGLVSENRCNCTVSPFGQNVNIGYYRLFSNSNVRAYNSGSNYTGGFVFWQNLTGFVEASTGLLELSNNLLPVTGSVSGNVLARAVQRANTPAGAHTGPKRLDQ